MKENFSERIENALNDIQKIQLLFRQRYGEECLSDNEIEEVLKIAKKEHEEIQQYRSIGTVEELKNREDNFKSREKYIKQILRERDIAIQQLEEIGVSFGEKMDSVKEAMERQMVKKPV